LSSLPRGTILDFGIFCIAVDTAMQRAKVGHLFSSWTSPHFPGYCPVHCPQKPAASPSRRLSLAAT
jgi:hypothetical protein